MTTSISGTTLTYPDGTTQTTANLGSAPTWANVTGRPGLLPSSAPAPTPLAGHNGNTWYHAGVAWGRNAGATGNCGVVGNYGNYSYLYLPQAGSYSNNNTTWDLYYATLNCYDCNCDCAVGGVGSIGDGTIGSDAIGG
jgi:hypothetical protein